MAAQPHRLEELSAKLPAAGITSYLPAAIYSPTAAYPGILSGLDYGGAGAEALGVHLEGPFLNPDRRGAYERRNVIPHDPGLASDPRPGALWRARAYRALRRTLRRILRGSETGIRDGLSGITHLFNAMSLLHHREPGPPGAALSNDHAICGVIPDGGHVHPEILRLAYRALEPDPLYLTTYAVSAAESPAVEATASTAAALIGAGDRKGRISPGYDADITVTAPGLTLESVWRAGRRLPLWLRLDRLRR